MSDPIEEMARKASVAIGRRVDSMPDPEHAAIIARHYRELSDKEAADRVLLEGPLCCTREKQVRELVLAAREAAPFICLENGSRTRAEEKRLRAILEQFREVK